MSVSEQDIVAELIAFARDQLAVLGDWRGRAYVRDCIELWRREYGDAVAQAVAAQTLAKPHKHDKTGAKAPKTAQERF